MKFEFSINPHTHTAAVAVVAQKTIDGKASGAN